MACLPTLSLQERGRIPPPKPTTHGRTKRSASPKPKKVKRFTYEAAPNSDTVKKLCFQPAQAHPRIRHRSIHLSEPQAPLHAHHAERKTKTYVFEVD